MAIWGSEKKNEEGVARKIVIPLHFEFGTLCYMKYEV